jgi:hypothetical protein
MSNQPTFETTGTNDPLGLWTPTVLGDVSFSTGGDPSINSGQAEPAEPIFRVNLPADGGDAAAALAVNEDYIASLNAALENVPSRLDGLVARTQQRQQKAANTGLSFDVLSLEGQESGPEGDLLALLGDIEAEGKRASGEISFGIGETASAAWEQAKAGFEALMEQINRDVLHFAWVETNVGGSLIARTTIGWSGDAQTVFLDEIGEAQVSLHERSLQIVTQTRSLRLRLFITIASGATKISALVTTPAGAVMALPAVYQYVMQIVAQVKQLQSIQLS